VKFKKNPITFRRWLRDVADYPDLDFLLEPENGWSGVTNLSLRRHLREHHPDLYSVATVASAAYHRYLDENL
jgi:hypothetical protein